MSYFAFFTGTLRISKALAIGLRGTNRRGGFGGVAINRNFPTAGGAQWL